MPIARIKTATRGQHVPASMSSKSTSSGRSRARRRVRVLAALVCCLFAVGLAEVGARAYWKLAWGVPLFQPARIWHAFYPEVAASQVEATALSRTDGVLDVLLLGGSVMHPTFGSVAADLQQQLGERFGGPVRVFNLANIAHNSRDSLSKYRALAHKPFDLVVVYHGINDVRMNNCPRRVFRADYSHAAWYACLAGLEHHPELPYLVLPYSLEYLWIQIADELGLTVPKHRPRAAWTNYGAELKTDVSFREHLEQIVRLAESKGDPVVLMTFAHYVPPGYSEPAFLALQLGYECQFPGTPIELWGAPPHVERAIAAHNRVVRELASEYPQTVFVDQDAEIPKQGRYFSDVCHLSEAGCRRLVRNLTDGLQRRSEALMAVRPARDPD